jgi:hypothetical protein
MRCVKYNMLYKGGPFANEYLCVLFMGVGVNAGPCLHSTISSSEEDERRIRSEYCKRSDRTLNFGLNWPTSRHIF